MLLYRNILRHTIQYMWLRSRNRTMSDNTKKPILYGDDISPPVRLVMMTASFLKIDMEFREINLYKSEHKTEFYTKINPLQKVPALMTEKGVICDSHAIALHLCRNYNDEVLYPNDLNLQSKIDEMIFFNSGTLFPIDSSIYSAFTGGKWPINEDLMGSWYSSLDHLERKLAQNKWLSGNEMRLCDLCCGATLSSVEVLVPVPEQHVKIKEWMKNLETLPCFENNIRGVARLKTLVKLLRKQIYAK